MINKINPSIEIKYNSIEQQNNYTQYFPTRDSKGSIALSLTVINPSYESLSKNKSFDDVSSSARAELDKQYSEMKKSGNPFRYDSNEGIDWYTLFQNFDRRALYAVSNNQNNKFSKEEQNIASSIMSQQQGLAMGLYSGPSRLEKNFSAPIEDSLIQRSKNGLSFLERVSSEEKSSNRWFEEHEIILKILEYTKEDEKTHEEETLISLLNKLKKDHRKYLYA